MKNLIDEATRFAAMKHDGHYRKGSNIPYISHPFGVALLLREEKQSEELIAAALLHDTLEDTDTTEEEIFNSFGEEILMLIKAASEPDKTLSWELRKQHTIESISFRSIEELYLILADKLHNLRSVQVDVNRQGNFVWSRFNRGKREQSWYYLGLACAMKKRKKEIPWIRQFEEEASELFLGKKRLSVSDLRLLFASAHSDKEQMEEDMQETGLFPFVCELHETTSALDDTERKAAAESVQKLLSREDLYVESQDNGTFSAYLYLHELKFRLGWDEETFLEYFKLYY